MTKGQVKSRTKQCVKNWADKTPHGNHKVKNLKGGSITPAQKQALVFIINTDTQFQQCGSVVNGSQFNGDTTVSQLGQTIWNNKSGCLAGLN